MIFIDIERKAGYNKNIPRCSGAIIKCTRNRKLCGNMIKIKNIKIYHIRILLLTYLVWTVLNLLIAWWFCQIAKVPLTRMPYYWGLLNIVPVIFYPLGTVAGLSVVAGLLIKERWACLLIITGMSL